MNSSGALTDSCFNQDAKSNVQRHEIDEVLQHIHENYVEDGEITREDNLHSIYVLFRLLRQQGFHVSPSTRLTLIIIFRFFFITL